MIAGRTDKSDRRSTDSACMFLLGIRPVRKRDFAKLPSNQLPRPCALHAKERERLEACVHGCSVWHSVDSFHSPHWCDIADHASLIFSSWICAMLLNRSLLYVHEATSSRSRWMAWMALEAKASKTYCLSLWSDNECLSPKKKNFTLVQEKEEEINI